MVALLLSAGAVGASTIRLPTFVRMWGSAGSANGQLNSPHSLTVDVIGNVIVADTENHRIQKLSPTGVYLTSWGGFGSGDGQFNEPAGVAVDNPWSAITNDVYVADTENHRIQRFTGNGVLVAKWGSLGSGNGQFDRPVAVALDEAGNIYVADSGNARIQKFSNSGVFITKWGSFGSGDGQFAFPQGVAIDTAGNVHVTDTFNHRMQKFSNTGTFLAKWGTSGAGAGEFNAPWGVAVDAAGNVYVADSLNARIQKFSEEGQFRGAWGSFGTGPGELIGPLGVGVAPRGSIYVSDNGGEMIQQFTLTRMIVGMGGGSVGWVADMSAMFPHTVLAWRQLGWGLYNNIYGDTRPALCDVDGDQKDELVLGLGTGGNGWLQIKNDADTDFANWTWIQIDWPSYNSANGETWPACGDIDGDGRDEIVVGLGNGGGGWARLFDDATTGFAPVAGTPTAGGWLRVPWNAYNSANGSLHAAVGNLDGDPRAEIAFGFGGGGAGWVHLVDDQATGFAGLAGTPGAGGWLQLGWPPYQAANGETWPAIGDLDGDGRSELVLGVGHGGGGWLRVFQDATGGFAAAPGTPAAGGWLRIDWLIYNLLAGASYPAVGDLDGDGRSELIIGLESFPASGGWMQVRQSLDAGLASRTWINVPFGDYNAANGLTRPAISR
jgi:DNA-binding beta-propeller fold protein YncE